jgi:hypothetical protein
LRNAAQRRSWTFYETVNFRALRYAIATGTLFVLSRFF